MTKRNNHVKVNEISSKNNVHAKVSRVIMQQGESIREDNRKGQSI